MRGKVRRCWSLHSLFGGIRLPEAADRVVAGPDGALPDHVAGLRRVDHLTAADVDAVVRSVQQEDHVPRLGGGARDGTRGGALLIGGTWDLHPERAVHELDQ